MSDQNPYSQPPGQQGGQYGYPQQPAAPYGYPQQPPGPYGYPQPGMPGAHDPHAPFGYDRFGRPYSDKSKVAAGLFQLFLGAFGVGRFYTGHVGIGLIQLFTCGGFGIWALIDAIMMLASDNFTDKQGRPLRG